MQIILLQDVSKIGRRYEVKEVASGFGRNFIVAKGLGMVATPSNLKQLEKLKAQETVSAKIHQDLLQKSLKSLKDIVIEISAKANEETGHLFASIQSEQIVQELKTQKQLTLLPEMLKLEKPIKAVGEHLIPVEFEGEQAEFKLVVSRLPASESSSRR